MPCFVRWCACGHSGVVQSKRVWECLAHTTCSTCCPAASRRPLSYTLFSKSARSHPLTPINVQANLDIELMDYDGKLSADDSLAHYDIPLNIMAASLGQAFPREFRVEHTEDGPCSRQSA